MTKREFYEAIAKGEVTVEMQELAVEYIEKMDESNEKRKTKVTAKQIENEAVKDKILAVLTAEGQTASTVGAAVEISTQKASALLRQLVADGKVVQGEAKVEKKGLQKVYTLA